MKERILVLIIVYGAMLLYDWYDLSAMNKLGGREKAVYAVLVAVSLYLALDFAVNQNWPDYYDPVKMILGKTAGQIDKMLTVPGK